MGYGALNPKLQELCRYVRLFEENTMYSFRRTAARETIDEHGIQKAQQLLNHAIISNAAIVHYDPVGLGRLDMTHFRIQGEELPPKEIDQYFRQSNLERFMPSGAPAPTLEQEFKQQVEAKLKADEEYEELETDLESILAECHEGLQERLIIPEEEDFIPTFGNNVYKYRLLHKDQEDADMVALLAKLESHLTKRKTRRRDLRIAKTINKYSVAKSQQLLDYILTLTAFLVYYNLVGSGYLGLTHFWLDGEELLCKGIDLYFGC